MKYINKNRKQSNTQATRDVAGGEICLSANVAFGHVSNAGSSENGDFQHIYQANAVWFKEICGDDELAIEIDAGNAVTGSLVASALDYDSSSDIPSLDGVSYSNRINNFNVMIGDSINIDQLSSVAIADFKSTKNMEYAGSHNVYSNGTAGALVLSSDLGNGISFAVGVGASDMNNWGNVLHFNISYDAEEGAVSYGYLDNDGTEYHAIHGLYKPNNAPTISVGYESGNSQTSWGITATTDVQGNKVNVGLGTNGSMKSGESRLHYEVSLCRPICDNLQATAYLYNAEQDGAADDQTGAIVSFDYNSC